MDNMAFGKQLKAARVKKKISMEELAQRIGISAKAISQIELGKRSTSLKTFVNICNILEIDPKYFLSKDLDEDLILLESDSEELFKSILNLPIGEINRFSDYVKLSIENKDRYK